MVYTNIFSALINLVTTAVQYIPSRFPYFPTQWMLISVYTVCLDRAKQAGGNKP